jgi:hypothetical protein
MFSRWRIIGLAFSVLLCLASMMLWARSYFYGDNFIYRRAHNAWWIAGGLDAGHLNIGFTTFSNLPGMQAMNGWEHYSYPVFQGWRNLTLRSIFNFQCHNSVNRLAGGARIHGYGVAAPIWSVAVLSAVFAAIIYFAKGRKTTVPRFRADISWTNPRLRARIARFAVFSATGIIAGAIVAWITVRFPFIESRYQWLMPWILLPVVSLMAVYTRRRIPWHRAMLWMALDLAGCVCFFQATIAKIWTGDHVYLFDISEMLQYVLLIGAACFICGAVLLFFLQVKPEPVKPGPYCPECGYCLIGLPRQICSECGRPFTLDELGIEAGALAPPSLSPT